MKSYYLLLVLILVFLTGCANYLNQPDIDIKKDVETIEDIYSVKDYKKECSSSYQVYATFISGANRNDFERTGGMVLKPLLRFLKVL